MSFTQPTETIEFKFSIGDDSDSEEEDKSSDKEVQTENKMSHYKPLQRLPSLQPPRSMEQCLEILNSDVSFWFIFTCNFIPRRQR